MSAVSVDEKMGIARHVVHNRTPYFRAALRALVPTPCAEVPTIAVTDRGVLLYNEQFIGKRTPEELAGLLCHEIMHVVQQASKRMGLREAELFNLALDLAINPAVLEMGYKLPDGDAKGCFPRDFGFPDGEAAEEYYERLKKSQKGGKGGDERGVGQGKCGSCASGEKHEAEGDEKKEAERGGRTQNQMAQVRRAVASAVRDAARQGKGRGNLPMGLVRWADAYLEPPKVDWRAQLGQALRSACAYRPGAEAHRYDSPSRLQAGLGYGPGRPVLPRLRRPVPNVAVVVDTSGSMTGTELGIALRELKGVLSAIGATVTLCTCDADVHGGLKQVRSIEQAAQLLEGGGGTDFRPAFEVLGKQRPAPELIVFATDGDGPAPAEAPRWARVVWLLTGKHLCVPASWGTVIEVEE